MKKSKFATGIFVYEPLLGQSAVDYNLSIVICTGIQFKRWKNST